MLVAEVNLAELAAPSLIWAKEGVVMAKEAPTIKQIAIVFIIPVLIIKK
jgi:hypothetical protein